MALFAGSLHFDIDEHRADSCNEFSVLVDAESLDE